MTTVARAKTSSFLLVAILAILAPLALVAGIGIGRQAAAPTPTDAPGSPIAITSVPTRIDRPGRYVLTGNLELASPSNVAIRIEASEVTLDLQGYSIRCTSNAPDRTSFGIEAEHRSGIVIRDGTLEGFYAGVFLRDTVTEDLYAPERGQHRVERLIVRNSTFIGIRVEGRACVIADNRVIDTGGSTAHPDAFAFGIEAIGPATTIRGNTVVNTVATGAGESLGISVSESGMACIVESNNIYNERQHPGRSIGVWIGGDSSATIVGNQVTNFDWGIAGSTPTRWVYKDNRLMGCVVPVLLPYFESAYSQNPPPVLRGRWQDDGGNVSIPFTKWDPVEHPPTP